jgi:hypothetical protein
MALWSWKTLDDGRVVVDKGDGFQPYESEPVAQVTSTADEVMAWRELAEAKAAKYGVPASWILAFIFAESGGNPSASNFCCTGLMAIMTQPPVHGKSKAQMLDPEQNVDYGASLIAQSAGGGNELPGVASIHVAGPKVGTATEPKQNIHSPWGMSEHMWLDNPQGDGSVGYIDRVVRANNMFVRLLSGSQHVPPPTTEPPPPLAKASSGLVPFAVGGALGVAAMLGLERALR